MSVESPKVVRIMIVACEESGDYLGANLIRELRKRIEHLEISGICGDAMIEQGASALYKLDEITSFFFANLLGRISRILKIRKHLITEVLRTKPDLYIGIDGPDFNLYVERKVREQGIPTVQYVAPTVWAWRQYRIKKIKQSVSKLLTIFPFESDLYRAHNIPFKFVGHPLADDIKEDLVVKSRAKFKFSSQDTVIAVLPGSRMSEVKRLASKFIKTAQILAGRDSRLKFVTAMATAEIHDYFIEVKRATAPELPMIIERGNSHEVIAASDVVILASGTAALESAFFGKPLVMAYAVSPLTYPLAKLLSNIDHYSVLNHLGPAPVIPEFIQNDCTAENLTAETLKILTDEDYRSSMIRHFRGFKKMMQLNSGQKVADEIVKLLDDSEKNIDCRC